MLRRELAIAFRARVTWAVAALGALFVGHGFVLALGIFEAASRASAGGSLMTRELDPLAGILRPTLGGVELAVTLFVPIVAARTLAIEKERGSFGALALAAGSPSRVVLAKLVAAVLAAMLLLAPAMLLMVLFVALGGHLDPIELGIALGGHVLHGALVAAIAVAAAAFAETVAQATTVALVFATASWVIDAGEGYAALAWLSPLQQLSVSRVLAPLEEGVVAVGSILWLVAAIGGAAGLAFTGGRFDLGRRRRATIVAAILFATALLLGASARVATAFDWTELRRASYPPAVVERLRAIPSSAGAIAIDVWLDREDSRRRQLERDALAKLTLARIGLTVRYPLDDAGTGADAGAGGGVYERGDAYGRLVVHVGERSGELRSISRREIATRLFEIAGVEVPSFDQAVYPGYPLALDEARLRFVAAFAYGVVPCIFVAAGLLATRRRRR